MAENIVLNNILSVFYKLNPIRESAKEDNSVRMHKDVLLYSIPQKMLRNFSQWPIMKFIVDDSGTSVWFSLDCNFGLPHLHT